MPTHIHDSHAVAENPMDSSGRVPEKDVLPIQRRGVCLAILVIATIAVEVPKLVAFLPEGRGWVLARETMVCGLMAGVPLLLARIAPEAAGFDRQWVPSARSHWGWFLGMLLLLFVGGGIATWLSGVPRPKFSPSYELISPATILVAGVIIVLVVPIAEEIFWRAYLLEQLRKLTYSSVALLSQSFLFALSHVSLLHQGARYLVAVFWYGMILGIWRIRFRSVLPLMLAHVILNVFALGAALKSEYDYAAHLWSKPHIRQIDSLTREPIQKAVPAIIAFLADPDEDVCNHAVLMLITRYRGDAEPYLKDALASSDTKIINGVLFVIDMAPSFGLKQEVRKIAWSTDDRTSQLAATLTLHSLGDVEGLRQISQRHPDETVRRAAKSILRQREEVLNP